MLELIYPVDLAVSNMQYSDAPRLHSDTIRELQNQMAAGHDDNEFADAWHDEDSLPPDVQVIGEDEFFERYFLGDE